MVLDFAPSEKDKACLSQNGFVYNKEKTMKSGKVAWACYKKKKDKCKGRAVSVGANHPTIWKLIDALKAEESLHRFRVLSILVGNGPAKRRRYISVEDRILNRVRKYATTQDKVHFVRMMAHNVNY